VRNIVPSVVLTPESSATLMRALLALRDGRFRFTADDEALLQEITAVYRHLTAVPVSILGQGISDPADDAPGSRRTMDDVMNATDAAIEIGITSRRVRQLAREGALPGVYTEAGWTFRRSDVEAYIATRTAA
jgi:hypothetical protein